jgi:hypothetical protein
MDDTTIWEVMKDVERINSGEVSLWLLKEYFRQTLEEATCNIMVGAQNP